VATLPTVAKLSRVPMLATASVCGSGATPVIGPDILCTVGFAAMQINGSGGLVAGGASGLGEATVRRLHAAGGDVVIADLNDEQGQRLARELGERARFEHADVTVPDQVQQAVDAAAGLPGGLRISVCCAGVGWAERVAGRRGPHSLEPFETVIRINLIGTFNVLRLAAAAMTENEPSASGERGVCVNTASIAAFDGQVGQISYSASKGAIVGMTLPAARDLASAGIRVCTIAPGTFDTPLLGALPAEAREALGQSIPFPSRLGRPDEFGALAAHIIENEMLNGEVIRLDGALRMPPR
jgi:3-hydroxyacyl-CoA dehydrogenase / 3-hydroxy-2-methylbutyryl-CoA dehydrogenase